MADRLEESREMIGPDVDPGVWPSWEWQAEVRWLVDEVDRLRAELNPEAKRLEDVIGDDAERIRRLRDAHKELNKALHELVVAYPVAATLDRQVHNVVAAQRSINQIHAEAS